VLFECLTDEPRVGGTVLHEQNRRGFSCWKTGISFPGTGL
jgi:hypothetical protein